MVLCQLVYVKNQLYSSGKYAKSCGSKLVKKTIINSEVTYRPLKTYCYDSVINNLEKLFMRPKLFQRCKEWRQREVPAGVYADIYDGEV